jgi:hypothetical protein
MFVNLQAQSGNLGQYDIGKTRIHQCLNAGTRAVGEQQLRQLVCEAYQLWSSATAVS